MMFEAICDSFIIFISIFNIIKDFLETIQIEISDTTFHIFGFDANQVLFLDVDLRPSFFKDYYIERSILVCFKIDNFNSILNNLNKSNIESIVLGYNDDFFYFRIIKTNGSVSNFRVPEIYTEIKEKNNISNSIEYQCEILMPSSILADVCKEFKSFKDVSLIIEANKNSIVFKIKTPLVYAESIFENKKTNDFYLSNKSDSLVLEFKNKYFLKIGNIIKKINIKECLLQIGHNLPLSLVFSISLESSFQFYLAPLLNDIYK